MFYEIIVTKDASIYQNNFQLCINSEQDIRVPIEDVDVLLIESRAVKITQQVICSLVENGSLVIMCNDKHMPSVIVQPMNNYCRRLSVLKLQINQPKVKIKHLWQSIIKQKISNQGKCLQYLDIHDCISNLANLVTSNDNNNYESIAANRYFKVLFGTKFARKSDSEINSLLNYGYAIIRASISRYLCIHGLEPSIGIFHHNELNNFNLADDLIEPFRPVVDLFVGQKIKNKQQISLDKKTKAELIQLLSFDISINGEIQTVNNAINLLIENLIRFYKDDVNSISLPSLLQGQLHSYE